jgi:hypothetical protein
MKACLIKTGNYLTLDACKALISRTVVDYIIHPEAISGSRVFVFGFYGHFDYNISAAP